MTREFLEKEVCDLSDGNPGAINAMLVACLNCPSLAEPFLMALRTWGIRGSAIWVAYKDYAASDLDKFVYGVIENNEEMLAVIRRELPNWRAA